MRARSVSCAIRVGPDRAQDLALVHGCCFDQPWSAETFRRLMENQGTFALLGHDATGAVAGFALVRVAGGESELLSLGVVPPSRRGGIAARLLAAALDRSAVAGAAAMVLEVAEDNTAARGLYDTFQFQPIGRRVRYYARAGGAADAITMKKTLAV